MGSAPIFNTPLVKYLQDDSPHKAFIGKRNGGIPYELMAYINKNDTCQTLSSNFSDKFNPKYDTIYVIIHVTDAGRILIPTIVELYWNVTTSKWRYLFGYILFNGVNRYMTQYEILDSCLYPTFMSDFKYNFSKREYFSDEYIIKILNKTKILNSDFRKNKFNEITIICIKTIIYLKYVFQKDLASEIVKIFLRLVPYWDDFIWHKKMKK
jgi:hypothetical protein